MLRLPAFGALYKEYLSGCIVLGLFYFHRMVIYPKIRFGITLRYILFGLLFALLSAILEMLLVYPQVMNLLTANYSREESFRVLFNSSFFVFLRDVGFLVISYFLSEFKSLKRLCNTYEIRISEKTKEIPVVLAEERKQKEWISLPISSKEQTLFVTEEAFKENEQFSRNSNFTTVDYLDELRYLPISKIWYCIQMKNTMFVYSLDNRLYFRSHSLKKFKSLVGEQFYFQVSRDTLVMRQYISNVGDRFVETVNPDTKEKKSFEISEAYLTGELISWGREKAPIDSEQFNDSCNKKESDPTVPIRRLDPLKQKKVKTIYSYISKHPYCKNPAISEKTKISVGTVNRILAQLRKEGLIEYVGSKKTGGYHVKEGTRQDSANSEVH